MVLWVETVYTFNAMTQIMAVLLAGAAGRRGRPPASC
jgi:hypothetical protein